ncbi:MAG: helix-turn-helix transcriptional regulator [Proteobacteria bacterium]|nr:helix-turn-helix transcriptional regulator [Pseudomonadota bacterium]
MTNLESLALANVRYIVQTLLDRGFKRYEIAAMMGIGLTQLSRWINGGGCPTLASLDNILVRYSHFCEENDMEVLTYGKFFGGRLTVGGEE